MPAPLDVNREAVRTLVISIGVREAARQMGLNQDTVAAWSARGKWLTPATNPPALPRSMQPVTPRHVSDPASNASKPSEALANMLESDSKRTKIGLSTATRKAAERFAGKSGDQIIDKASELRQIAAAASTVHGWAEKTDGGINLQLGVMITGMD